jgi:hypothetical protein
MPSLPMNISEQRYDAFVSYASADRSRAKKVQTFLQSYRPQRSKGGLVVYLDQTDIRGGDLGVELEILCTCGVLLFSGGKFEVGK